MSMHSLERGLITTETSSTDIYGSVTTESSKAEPSSKSASEIFSGFITAVEFPISILRWLSIGGGDGKWNARRRWITIVSWPFGLMIILLDMGNWSAFTEWSAVKIASDTSPYNGEIPLWSFALAIGAVLGLFTFITTSWDKKPKFYIVFVVYSFAVTIAWLDIIADECVQVAECLGEMLGIDTALLGLTILAW